MGAGLVAALAVGGSAYAASLEGDRVLAGIELEGVPLGGRSKEELSLLAGELVERSSAALLELRAGERRVARARRDLGAIPHVDEVATAALAAGRSGELLQDLRARESIARGGLALTLGHSLDLDRALASLEEARAELETPSLATRLDLERRRVLPAQAGTLLLAYDSLSPLAVALAAGAREVELRTAPRPPVEDPLAARIVGLDPSTVVGRFETPYQQDAHVADRVHNLEAGAAAVDGTILQPGETFSFNRVVGERSAEEGFRYAGGITSGEMVDVLGGGICQVSSTLFGAAFFSGLQLDSARPHSRPSAYVDMGLDSTVVYPSVDLRFTNTFDFPVVLHMVVRGGKVHAEILGARRPYRVTFQRKLIEAVPFESSRRVDPALRAGAEEVVQRGMRGFKVTRTRKVWAGAQLVREETAELSYPPTREIVAVGTGGARARAPKPRNTTRLRDPAQDLELVQ